MRGGVYIVIDDTVNSAPETKVQQPIEFKSPENEWMNTHILNQEIPKEMKK